MIHGEKMIYVADLNSTVHPISVGEGGGGCVTSTRSTVRCTIVMAIMHEYQKNVSYGRGI